MLEALPLSLRAYRLLTAAATPLAPALLSHRLKRGKEHPERLNERYGETRIARPPGPLVWIHGASVGELLAVIPLIERIRDKEFGVLCTSGTVTSANLAEQRLPPDVIHQFVALDAPRFVKRFFDHWRPDLALFVESDLWPNLIMTGAARGIPLILVNGRMSERSFGRWRLAPGFIAALLRCFDLCLAQSAAHAGRYPRPRRAAHRHHRQSQARRAGPAGRRREPGRAQGRRSASVPSSPRPRPMPARRRCCSTRIGGCAIRSRSCSRSSRRAIPIAVPASSRSRAPPASRRCCARAANCRVANTDVYVADTLGELGLIYRLAPIVFVGGSLASHGGQNPIEPIKLGAAILHGPHVWNFAEIYAALDKAHGAEQVTDVGKLAVRVGAWLTDADERAAVVAAARETVATLGGALERTLAAIEPYLMQIRLERRDGDA